MPSLYFWDPCADGASVMVCAVIKKRTTDRDADLGKGYFCPRIRTQSYRGIKKGHFRSCFWSFLGHQFGEGLRQNGRLKIQRGSGMRLPAGLVPRQNFIRVEKGAILNIVKA